MDGIASQANFAASTIRRPQNRPLSANRRPKSRAKKSEEETNGLGGGAERPGRKWLAGRCRKFKIGGCCKSWRCITGTASNAHQIRATTINNNRASLKMCILGLLTVVVTLAGLSSTTNGSTVAPETNLTRPLSAIAAATATMPMPPTQPTTTTTAATMSNVSGRTTINNSTDSDAKPAIDQLWALIAAKNNIFQAANTEELTSLQLAPKTSIGKQLASHEQQFASRMGHIAPQASATVAALQTAPSDHDQMIAADSKKKKKMMKKKKKMEKKHKEWKKGKKHKKKKYESKKKKGGMSKKKKGECC